MLLIRWRMSWLLYLDFSWNWKWERLNFMFSRLQSNPTWRIIREWNPFCYIYFKIIFVLVRFYSMNGVSLLFYECKIVMGTCGIQQSPSIASALATHTAQTPLFVCNYFASRWWWWRWWKCVKAEKNLKNLCRKRGKKLENFFVYPLKSLALKWKYIKGERIYFVYSSYFRHCFKK